jgi:DNA-binding beta-propeller fold protein YncE
MNRQHVVKVFTGEGDFLRQWGSLGNGDGQLKTLFGVAVSPTECVYVSDTNYHVQIFSATGVFQGKWGSEGSGDSEFRLPVDVAIDSNGAVYVLDSQSIVRKFSGGIVPVEQSTWGQLKLRYR